MNAFTNNHLGTDLPAHAQDAKRPALPRGFDTTA
jgi:hypothetical protein